MRAAAAFVCLATVAFGACAPPADDGASFAGLNGIRFLAESAGAGFEAAITPREFQFPADHGSHPGYRTEWWYYTGNLRDRNGRHFGFELTFFRLGLIPEPARSGSAWAASDAWMAHFAVTDTAGGELIAEERFARGALGLAGARAMPFRVWVESWSANDGGDPAGESMELTAAGARAALALRLRAVKPPVAHGVRGLDPKGPEPGNASYYYSLTRLEARGTVDVDGEAFDVQGLAWMDREWGTSALSQGTVGWDWFALQLEDGRDLMWYRLRLADGTASPFSGGSLVETDGTRIPLEAQDVAVEAFGEWRSPTTGTVYPTHWRLAVPRAGLTLSIEPYIEGQEVALSVRYWEGAVRVSGAANGRAVRGDGYLELAGY